MYVRRKYTEAENERARYFSDKLGELVGRQRAFEPIFDILAGQLVGLGVANGMTILEVVETIGWLVQNDSPDGRTSEQIIAAFSRGRAS